jgi:hypothetical protein
MMWLPKNEKQIIDAVTSGSLEETVIFDAKKEISAKNQEIAKDIASMANEGGIIIYGIGEDENKRLTMLNPIPIAGQMERIDAVVRSCIAEPPQIQITSIPTEKDPSIGYLVVVIPPSERAPHMVVVKGDNRYYGRTATGNAPLNEGEVARLYTRREKTEIDRNQLLEDEINSSSLEPNSNFAYLYLLAKPVFSREGFFDSISQEGKKLQDSINELIIKSGNSNLNNLNQFTIEFNPPYIWKQKVDGLLGKMGWESNDLDRLPASMLNLIIDFDGTCHLFFGRAGEKTGINEPINIFTETIAGLSYRFIILISTIFELSEYMGMIDLGIALTGLKGSVVFTNNWRIQLNRSPFDQESYKKTGRFSNLVIINEPEIAAKYLVMPFINTISQNRINPFEINRSR